MDFLQDQALSYLRSSPALLSSLTSALFTTSSSTRGAQSSPAWQHYIETYLLTPLTSFLSNFGPAASTSTSNSSGPSIDILTTILLLATLFIFFKIANYIRRLVMWWVFLFVKLAVLYGILMVGWSVWFRGLDVTIRDVASIWGFVEGVLEFVGKEFGGGSQGAGGRGPKGYDAGRGPGRGVYGSGYGGGGGGGYGYRGGRGQVPVGTRRGVWV